MPGRGPGDPARGAVGKTGETRGEMRTPRKGRSSNSPCGTGGGGGAEGGAESGRRAAAWSSGEGGEGEGVEEGEARGRRMRRKMRRMRMGGRRRRGLWVGSLEARGEDETEEEGGVEEGDEGRGWGEKDLSEWREVGRGVGGLFVRQVTSEQPMAWPDLMLQCDEAVLEAGRSRCSFSGAASLFLHHVSPSFPPYLLLYPPLFLLLAVPSTLPSPSLHQFRCQMEGRRWWQEERKERNLSFRCKVGEPGR